MRSGNAGERRSDVAFSGEDVEIGRMNRVASRQLPRRHFEHRGRHARNAGKDEDVADPKTRRVTDRIVDQARAGGDSRHLQARLVERSAVMLQTARGFLVDDEFGAESLGDRLGRYVVVRGADSSRRKDVAVGAS